MAASFGEQLRLAREARGISLREISEQTRISTRYLEAIESGDLKRLPGGIFNRSFIKAYAKYVGYDEKEALEAYARTAREQGGSDEVATTPYKSHVYTDGSGSRSPLMTLLLSFLILAILVLGVWAALHWYQRREAGAANETPTTTNAPQQSTAPAQSTNGQAAPTAATAGFVIQLKTRDQEAWVKTRVDEEDSHETILKPGEVKELKPTQRLSIKYAKIKAGALELTINGRPAKVTATSTTNPVEMVITKDDYEKFLQ
ncbi:MAG TPA: RodZ domain-containing protein [Pyrinomonadaceae bacterium]